MNSVCDLCTHQEMGPIWRGEVRCGKAGYSYNEGYGPFKGGAVCSYDSDLKNLFSPRTGTEISVKNSSVLLANQANEISSLKQQISILQHRLTKVE